MTPNVRKAAGKERVSCNRHTTLRGSRIVGRALLQLADTVGYSFQKTCAQSDFVVCLTPCTARGLRYGDTCVTANFSPETQSPVTGARKILMTACHIRTYLYLPKDPETLPAEPHHNPAIRDSQPVSRGQPTNLECIICKSKVVLYTHAIFPAARRSTPPACPPRQSPSPSRPSCPPASACSPRHGRSGP